MRKNSQAQQQQSKFKQAVEDQQPRYSHVTLQELFKNFPNIQAAFDKGDQQTTSTTPNCEECESETTTALMECKAVLHRVGTLAALVQDLTLKQVVTPSRQRALAILEEIENLVTDGRNAIEEAGI